MKIKDIIRIGMGNSTPVESQKQRSSNFELYRIIVMLLIVAHHYVVLSGLAGPDGILNNDVLSANSIYLYLFGMWGKTGINCFLLITGYFMCTSNISLRKFLKLYLWIIIYRIALLAIFVALGTETISLKSLLLLLPFTNIHSNSFTSAFMAWWLFIPFLNVLVNNITQKQHKSLIVLTLLFFSIYPFFYKLLHIDNNPICWFSTLYVIASYIRKYPDAIYKYESCKFWCLATVSLIILSMLSVIAILWLGVKMDKVLPQYYMVSDSDKPLALMVAVSSFIWFKNVKMEYSKIINILGGASYGVLLIHSGSLSMKNWLWKDAIDCVGHYSLPLYQLIIYSVGCVIAIYIVCATIDYIRLKLLEESFFKWYDLKMKNKLKI